MSQCQCAVRQHRGKTAWWVPTPPKRRSPVLVLSIRLHKLHNKSHFCALLLMGLSDRLLASCLLLTALVPLHARDTATRESALVAPSSDVRVNTTGASARAATSLQSFGERTSFTLYRIPIDVQFGKAFFGNDSKLMHAQRDHRAIRVQQARHGVGRFLLRPRQICRWRRGQRAAVRLALGSHSSRAPASLHETKAR
jgi:hypothetical protein